MKKRSTLLLLLSTAVWCAAYGQGATTTRFAGDAITVTFVPATPDVQLTASHGLVGGGHVIVKDAVGTYNVRIIFKRKDGTTLTVYDKQESLTGYNMVSVNYKATLTEGDKQGVLYAEIEKAASNSVVYKSNSIELK